MPVAPPNDEEYPDPRDPAEQGKWGDRDLPPDPKDWLPDWADEDDDRPRQSQK